MGLPEKIQLTSAMIFAVLFIYIRLTDAGLRLKWYQLAAALGVTVSAAVLVIATLIRIWL